MKELGFNYIQHGNTHSWSKKFGYIVVVFEDFRFTGFWSCTLIETDDEGYSDEIQIKYQIEEDLLIEYAKNLIRVF